MYQQHQHQHPHPPPDNNTYDAFGALFQTGIKAALQRTSTELSIMLRAGTNIFKAVGYGKGNRRKKHSRTRGSEVQPMNVFKVPPKIIADVKHICFLRQHMQFEEAESRCTEFMGNLELKDIFFKYAAPHYMDKSEPMVRRGFAIVPAMVGQGQRPDIELVRALLDLCTHRRLWLPALEWFEWLRRERQKPLPAYGDGNGGAAPRQEGGRRAGPAGAGDSSGEGGGAAAGPGAEPGGAPVLIKMVYAELLENLQGCGLGALGDIMAEEGVRAGDLPPPFPPHPSPPAAAAGSGGGGGGSNAAGPGLLDLHHQTVATARAAVRTALADLLRRPETRQFHECSKKLRLITGIGNRSERNVAKIKPAIESLLRDELGIQYSIVPSNPGCIDISSSELTLWVQQSQTKQAQFDDKTLLPPTT